MTTKTLKGKVLADPAVRFRVKNWIKDIGDHDPVDAIADAELLLKVLKDEHPDPIRPLDFRVVVTSDMDWVIADPSKPVLGRFKEYHGRKPRGSQFTLKIVPPGYTHDDLTYSIPRDAQFAPTWLKL